MVKQAKAQEILNSFSLVKNNKNQKFFFINKHTKEKTKEFDSKELGLEILKELNNHGKITNDQELDLITLILKENALPMVLFVHESRESFLDHCQRVILEFQFRLRFLKNIEGSHKKRTEFTVPGYANPVL